MTDEIEDYMYDLDHPREAAERRFLDAVCFNNLEIAQQLLSGDDPVDISCVYPGGQRRCTWLH